MPGTRSSKTTELQGGHGIACASRETNQKPRQRPTSLGSGHRPSRAPYPLLPTPTPPTPLGRTRLGPGAAGAAAPLLQRLLHDGGAVIVGGSEAQVVVGAQVEAAPAGARQLEGPLHLTASTKAKVIASRKLPQRPLRGLYKIGALHHGRRNKHTASVISVRSLCMDKEGGCCMRSCCLFT